MQIVSFFHLFPISWKNKQHCICIMLKFRLFVVVSATAIDSSSIEMTFYYRQSTIQHLTDVLKDFFVAS